MVNSTTLSFSKLFLLKPLLARQIFLSLVLSAIAAPLAAETGRVTVDGKLLSPALFNAPVTSLGSKNNCPPGSDDRIREHVVMLHLLVREGKRQGFKPDKIELMSVERAQNALDTLPADAAEFRRAQLEYDRLWNEARVYRTLLIGKIGEDEIAERYRQAIDEKHPELVNVVLLRYTRHGFGSEQARTRAIRELELGSTAEQLIAAGRFGRFDVHEDEQWRRLDRWTHIEPTADKLTPGDVAIYTQSSRSLLHVTDTKTVPQIRPNQSVNGDEQYALKTARSIIYDERQHALEARVREEAVVREDDVVVFPRDTYPAC